MEIPFIQPTPDFSQYYPSVGCVVRNKNGLILYCQRADIPGAWQLPQGGIDQNETPEAAVLRELFEETAITDATIKSSYPHWLVYPFPPHAKKRHGRIGQAQKWFLLEFSDKEVNLQNARDKEFTEAIWATPAHILNTVVPFRRPLYEECFKFFGLL